MDKKVWTAWEIERILKNTEGRAEYNAQLEKMIVRMLAFQTATEQTARQTIRRNAVGWSQAHASFLTYCAKWIQGGNHLSGEFQTKARRFMLRYCNQLSQIANGTLEMRDLDYRR